MDRDTSPVDLLTDLETRHDELLRRLEDLDQQVLKVLAECQGLRRRSSDAPRPAEAA